MDALGNTNALSGRLSGLMLGQTTSGSAWAYKALHPSDTVVGIGGVPDKTCFYTTFQNYMQQISINPTELLGIKVSGETNATPMWSMDIIQSPHPLYPLRIRLWEDHNATNFRDFVVYNNQLGVNLEDIKDSKSFIQLLNQAFSKNFEKYRIAYQGVTINSTASDMFNQGNVTATQYTWPVTYNQNFRIDSLYDFFVGQTIADATIHGSPYLTNVQSRIVDPNQIALTMQCGSAVIRDNIKTYDELIQMPLSYTGVAKIGVYQPLKLTDFTWKKTDDLYYYLSDSYDIPFNAPYLAPSNARGLGDINGHNHSYSSFYHSSPSTGIAVGTVPPLPPSSQDDSTAAVVVPNNALKNDAAASIRNSIDKNSIIYRDFKFGPLSNVWARSTPFNYLNTDGKKNAGYANLNLFPIHAFCGDKFGQISFRALSSQNPLILTFRQGIETVVTPGSLLSMYARPSMTPDETALLAYAQLVNVLSDAWPAYYNDWNKLKLKLMEAWNWFRPYASRMWKSAAPIALEAFSDLII